jgi:hypothetical protein
VNVGGQRRRVATAIRTGNGFRKVEAAHPLLEGAKDGAP